MEEGLVSPQHLVVDTFPAEQGSQRVTDLPVPCPARQTGATTLYKAKKILQIIQQIAPFTAGGSRIQAEAETLQTDLKAQMRTFGRQCRGKGKVYLKWVRETEKRLLSIGCQVTPLALCAQMHLQKDIAIDQVQQERLMHKLDEALQAHRHIEKQSRQLVNGKNWITVKSSMPTCLCVTARRQVTRRSPRSRKARATVPANSGKNQVSSLRWEPASSLAIICLWAIQHDASYLPARSAQAGALPLVQTVDGAIDLLDFAYQRRKPLIRSLAGDLGLDDPNLRNQLHFRGIATLGIPSSIAPIPKVPTPEMIKEALHIPGLEEKQNATQIKIAHACAYSRPFVENLITTLTCLRATHRQVCRGATRIKYRGHQGASIQIGMVIVAANATTLVRIKHDRLSKQARTFRHLFRLKHPNSNKNNTPNV